MIDLEHIRDLSISAASGLIFFRDHYFAISDDDNILISFSEDSDKPEKKTCLRNVILPTDAIQRKKVKPDFESLLIYNSSLMIIPSGSTRRREIGFLVSNDEILELSFSSLYLNLRKTIPNLNLEGSFLFENEIFLFNRGNAAASENAIICINAELPFLGNSIKSVRIIRNMPEKFGLTDVAFESIERIWFTAVIEDTNNSYDDGLFSRAILGYMNIYGEVKNVFELNIKTKPEGLCLNLLNRCFWVVTDADNPQHRSQFLKGKLPS